MATRYGWHIVRANLKLGYGDNRFVRVGTRMGWRIGGASPLFHERVRLCQRGMHASPTVSSAVACALLVLGAGGVWLCRVKVEGTGANDTDLADVGDTAKFVGTHRTVLGMVRLDEVESPHGFLPFAPEKRALALIRKRNRRLGLKTKVR